MTFRALRIRNEANTIWYEAASQHEIAGDTDSKGVLHKITGARWSLVGATSLNTLGLITPSSQPSEVSPEVILKTDSFGRFRNFGMGIGADPLGQELRLNGPLTFVGSQQINTTLAGNLTLRPAGNLNINPFSGVANISTSTTLKVDNYASQTTGWGIFPEGSADFRYLFVDELHAKTFIADLEQALAGGQIIAKSVAILAEDFPAPVASHSAVMTVEDFPGFPGVQVFQANDYVGLRQFDRTDGSLTIGWCWGVVSGFVDNANGTQSWTFTRHSTIPGIASGTINAGTLAIDFGVSGNGYYEVSAIDGLWGINSPYAQIVTWVGHPATRTVRARLGNLRGITGTAEYGLFAGSGTGNLDSYLRFSNIAAELHNIPLRVHDGTNLVARLEHSGPYFGLGAGGAPTSHLGADGFWVGRDGNATKFHVGNIIGNVLSWDGSNITLGVLAGHRLVADGTSLTFLNASTQLAKFSSASLIMGQPTSSRVEITWSSIGILSGTGTTKKTMFRVDTLGRLSVGSDISIPARTTLVTFGSQEYYNNEGFAPGDILIGDNSTGKANLKWTASTGRLNFRGGTSTQLHIGTDGALTAGGGNVRLSSTGIRLTTALTWGGLDASSNIVWGTSASVGATYAIEPWNINSLRLQVQKASNDHSDPTIVLGSDETGPYGGYLNLTAAETSISGSLNVGSSLYLNSSIYGLRRNGVNIEWYNGTTWVQLN